VNKFIGAIIALEILSASFLFSYRPTIPPLPTIAHDFRISALAEFMEKHKFAKPYYVQEYIQSADRYHIDYRLVASIAVAESSGCKHYIYNDCFGYGSSSGLMHFTSIPEGIRFVSEQLGEASYYAGKSDLDKARAYGPHSNPNYGPTIIRYMNEINADLLQVQKLSR
jgi:hypothetical protein